MILAGKIALITGGGGVIGRTIAKQFCLSGATVILIGRTGRHLARVKNEIEEQSRASISTYEADVAKHESVQRLMRIIASNHGRLDILVTAAGVYGEIGSVEQCDATAWLEAITINLFGTMATIKYALPLLKKSSRAKILTFAGGGEGPLPNFSSYASSKGAVLRFTETVAAELKPYTIDVNAISPGLVNSGFVEDLIAAGPERAGKEKYEEAQKQVAGMGGSVPPDKAAALAVFLASSASDGLSGKNISAIWDRWEDIPQHLAEINGSDIYNWRRIKPKDRGYDW